MTTDIKAADEAADDKPETGARQQPARWMRVLISGGVVLALLLLGASLGMLVQLPGRGPAEPSAASVDVGFSQDMTTHHLQAVLMAGLARDRTSDPEVRSLAFDIERTQQEQVGRMQGWLSLWNAAPLADGKYMTWMADDSSMAGMGHGAGTDSAGVATMPGMASPAELQQLQAAGGRDLDVLFLQLMLRHHQGAVPMAKYAAAHAETAQVRNLAEKMVTAQSAEVDYMTDLLTRLGAQPLPPPF